MKSPVTSKTLWFNLIALIAIIATEVAGWDVVVQNPDAAKVVGVVILVVNMVLRFMTKTPIAPVDPPGPNDPKTPIVLLAILGIGAAPVMAQSQTGNDWSLGAYYSFTAKDYAAVTANKLVTIENLFGLRYLDPEVNAFAGVSTSGVTLVGFSTTLSLKIGEGLYIFAGPAVDGDITTLAKLSLGVHGGIRYSIPFRT